MKSQPALILASSSIYRRELLNRLGIPFDVLAPRVDETPRVAETAQSLAPRLARAKAQDVCRQRPGVWAIGSDQAASCEGRILGKPQTRERCIEQLSLSSGKDAFFYTAVAIAAEEGSQLHEYCDTTRVRFRRLETAEITDYVDRESPLDCAGGFKSEGLGISLFDRIESDDPTALVGLPLIAVARILRQIGLKVP